MSRRERMIAKCQKETGLSWVKDGAEFDGGSAILWSGEGATILVNGQRHTAFNHYSENYDLYIFGVHKILHDWATKNKMHWEAYDAGTFFTYKD